MATISNPWIWVVAAVAWITIAVVAVVRVRRARTEKEMAEAREREMMASRLSQLEDTQPLTPPPSVYTRPEERWATSPLRYKRRQDRKR